MHKINRYFCKYRRDKEGTYTSFVEVHNVQTLSGKQFLDKVYTQLVEDIWYHHRITASREDLDIISLNLIDAITHIELT